MPDHTDTTPFQSVLQSLDVVDISRCLYGCPIRTIYCWRDGSRTPPAWLQSLILAALGHIRLEYERKNKLRDAQSEK